MHKSFQKGLNSTSVYITCRWISSSFGLLVSDCFVFEHFDVDLGLGMEDSLSWNVGSLSVTFSMCLLSVLTDFLMRRRTIRLKEREWFVCRTWKLSYRASSPQTQIPSWAAIRSFGLVLVSSEFFSEIIELCLGKRSP